MCRKALRRRWICSAAGRSSGSIIWLCPSACSATGAGACATASGSGPDMARLSAIIIAKNEARNIGACLDSLKFCDERIVVDGGSDDETAAIAQKKGAQVVVNRDWSG